MAPVTDEDLKQKEANLAELREAIAETRAVGAAALQEKTNAARAAELEREENRLLAELDAVSAETARILGVDAPPNVTATQVAAQPTPPQDSPADKVDDNGGAPKGDNANKKG